MPSYRKIQNLNYLCHRLVNALWMKRIKLRDAKHGRIPHVSGNRQDNNRFARPLRTSQPLILPSYTKTGKERWSNPWTFAMRRSATPERAVLIPEDAANATFTAERDGTKYPRAKISALMILTFALGVATMIAHHTFNIHLDGKPLEDVSISQEWVTVVGTAFGFVFKIVLFVGLIKVVYVQLFWSNMHCKSIRTRCLDSMFTIPSNPLALPELLVFRRWPSFQPLAGSSRFPRFLHQVR